MKEGSIRIMRSWIENLNQLDRQTRLDVWDYLMQCVVGRQPEETTPIIAVLAQSYLDQIERMEDAKAAGKKGGRPRTTLPEIKNPHSENQKPPFSDLETPLSETENPPFNSLQNIKEENIKEENIKEENIKEESIKEEKGEYEGKGVIGGQTPEPPSAFPVAAEKKSILSVAAMAGEGAAAPPKAQKSKTSRFRAPTVEEVAAYCKERENCVSAQSFVDFYSSKGWMVGKNSMKDWKAAVRTWELRDRYAPTLARGSLVQEYPQEEYQAALDLAVRKAEERDRQRKSADSDEVKNIENGYMVWK